VLIRSTMLITAYKAYERMDFYESTLIAIKGSRDINGERKKKTYFIMSNLNIPILQ
jgi:hypothetical protein